MRATGDMRLGFVTLRGRKFPHGNFRTTRVLRSQNTTCRKNAVFRQVKVPFPFSSYRAHPRQRHFFRCPHTSFPAQQPGRAASRSATASRSSGRASRRPCPPCGRSRRRACSRRRRCGCPSRSRPFPAHGRAPSCSEWPHGAGAASQHRKPVCRAPDACASSFHAQRRTSSEAPRCAFRAPAFSRGIRARHPHCSAGVRGAQGRRFLRSPGAFLRADAECGSPPP